MVKGLLGMVLLQVCIQLAMAHEEAFGVQERTGNYLPDSIFVYNEDSVVILLNDLFQEPVLIVPMYYSCQAECPDMLTGLAELVQFSKRIPEKDYRIVCLSIDHKEAVDLARQRKRAVYQPLNRKLSPYFWRFVTADSSNIKQLCHAAGWQFRATDRGFIHPTASLLLSPDGKISQYFYGSYFNYMHFDLAVDIANKGEVQPTRTKTMKYCIPEKIERSNPITRMTTWFGILVVLTALLLFWYLKRNEPGINRKPHE